MHVAIILVLKGLELTSNEGLDQITLRGIIILIIPLRLTRNRHKERCIGWRKTYQGGFPTLSPLSAIKVHFLFSVLHLLWVHEIMFVQQTYLNSTVGFIRRYCC